MPTWLKAAPCRKRARTSGLYPGGCWVAECEYQQPCHRQRHADQQPQAWRVCTRVGQLRRFTVQNGKGHGVGVIGARLKLVFVLNCQSINITLALLGKFNLNWISVRRYVPGSRFVNLLVISPLSFVVAVMEPVFLLSN